MDKFIKELKQNTIISKKDIKNYAEDKSWGKEVSQIFEELNNYIKE